MSVFLPMMHSTEARPIQGQCLIAVLHFLLSNHDEHAWGMQNVIFIDHLIFFPLLLDQQEFAPRVDFEFYTTKCKLKNFFQTTCVQLKIWKNMFELVLSEEN